MTIRTRKESCLSGSKLSGIAGLPALVFAVICALGAAQPGLAQVPAKKPAAKTGEKIAHGYKVHQSTDLGGRIAQTSGSKTMWSTMFNQSGGGRLLGQSIELRSVDPTKTPLVDSLSTYTNGLGGDPYDVARLHAAKGRIWEFAGNFHRDRNFFDYNQFANSLLTAQTPASTATTGPVVVPEPNSLHVYNTVRRNTDAQLTLLPLFWASIRAGWNHGTHEGPSLITDHSSGGDNQVYQWFRNGEDVFTGGIDLKVAKKTTLSYDQSFVLYKGDSSFVLATPTNNPLSGLMAHDIFPVSDATQGVASATGLWASPGVEVYNSTAGCGQASIKGGTTTLPDTRSPYVTNGVLSKYCKAASALSLTSPIRSMFPTEQIRFSSHALDRLTVMGRAGYSAGESTIDAFNLSYSGYGNTKPAYTTSTKTWNSVTIGSVETGNGTNGQFAKNKRASNNADLSVAFMADKSFTVTDNANLSAFRTEGWTSTTTTSYTIPTNLMPSLLTTPASAGVVAKTTTAGVTSPAGAPTTTTYWLDQQYISNSLLGSWIASPKVKLSFGWRFRDRAINYSSPSGYVATTAMKWQESAGLFGAAVEPARNLKLNVNYELSDAHADGAATLSRSFTRSAPAHWQQFKTRVNWKAAPWATLSGTANLYYGSNADPLVNHVEHHQSYSANAMLNPGSGLTAELAYAWDDVYSRTDVCYQWTADTLFPQLPTGAAQTGTCAAVNSPLVGAGTYYLSHGNFEQPTTFWMAVVNYSVAKRYRATLGARESRVEGSSEMLNPFQIPGALNSRTLTPFAETELKVAGEWSWHGSWNYQGYGEQGPLNVVSNGLLANGLPSRNTHGNLVTLGVKYEF